MVHCSCISNRYQSKYNHTCSAGTTTRYMYISLCTELKTTTQVEEDWRPKEATWSGLCQYIQMQRLAPYHHYQSLGHSICQDWSPQQSCPLLPDRHASGHWRLCYQQCKDDSDTGKCCFIKIIILNQLCMLFPVCCQLWTKILKMHPIPPFTQAAVYSLWQNITSKAWKQADDEVTSAKILLEEARQPFI